MNEMPTLHFCLVSEQPLANLIPILQYHPERIALGVTPGMKEKGEKFRKLLASLDYGAERVDVFDVPENGIESIREKALEIGDTLRQRHPGHRIAYNATGGTKPMVLGFAEFLGGDQFFYTDTRRHCIEHIHPRPRTEPMQSVLGVDVYLRAHGKQPRRADSDAPDWLHRADSRKALTKWLAENAAELGGFFGMLNALTDRALAAPERGQPPRIEAPHQTLRGEPHGIWREALAKIKQAGLCQWDDARPLDLYIDQAEGARYLHGHWLEEYVWHVVKDAHPEEVKAGIEFTAMTRAKDDPRNELDCVAAHRNRLLLVECKTGGMEDGKDAHVVYKLDSIGHDMGLFQKRLLVSAREVDATLRARAAEESIDVVGPRQLGELRQIVLHWMNG